MRKMLITIITIVCGWIGWYAGDLFNFTTAFLLSMVGTGLGLYYGRKLVQF